MIVKVYTYNEEKKKTDKLLGSLLPKKVIKQLKRGELLKLLT